MIKRPTYLSKKGKLIGSANKFVKGGGLAKYAPGGGTPTFLPTLVPTRQDSLALYNNALKKIKFYKGNPDYQMQSKTTSYFDTDFKDADTRKNLIKEANQMSQLGIMIYTIEELINNARRSGKPLTDNQKSKLRQQLNKRTFGKVRNTNLTSFGDIMQGEADTYFNPLAPPIYLHPNITPQGYEAYESDRFKDRTQIPFYDPIAIAPFDILNSKQQKKRLKKYGTTGTPFDKSVATKVIEQPKDKNPLGVQKKIEQPRDEYGESEDDRKTDTLPSKQSQQVTFSPAAGENYKSWANKDGYIEKVSEKDPWLKELFDEKGEKVGYWQSNNMGIPDIQLRHLVLPKKQIGGGNHLNYITNDTTHYDHLTNDININKEDKIPVDNAIAHEFWHHYQNMKGWNRLPEDFPTMKRPQTPSSDNANIEYFNRRNDDNNELIRGFKNRYPEFNMVPDNVISDRETLNQMYQQPWTLEGEARAVESPEGREWLSREENYDLDEYDDLLKTFKFDHKETLDKYQYLNSEVSSGDPKTKKRFSPLLQSVMDDRASNVSNSKAKIPASLINPAYNNVKVAPTKQATISQTSPDYRSAIAKKEEMQRGLENENLILNKQTGQYQKSLVKNTPANQMKVLLGAAAAPFIAAGALSGAGTLASSGIGPAIGTALETSPSWAPGLSINNAFGVLGMSNIANKGLLSDEYARNINNAKGAWETTKAVGEPIFDVLNAGNLATKMGPAFYNAAQNLGKSLKTLSKRYNRPTTDYVSGSYANQRLNESMVNMPPPPTYEQYASSNLDPVSETVYNNIYAQTNRNSAATSAVAQRFNLDRNVTYRQPPVNIANTPWTNYNFTIPTQNYTNLIKNSFNKPKLGEKINTALGKLLPNNKNSIPINLELFENDVNKLLEKGVGIHKNGTKIKVERTKYGTFEVFIQPKGETSFVKSGSITADENKLTQKTFTKKIKNILMDSYPNDLNKSGLIKNSDFPTKYYKNMKGADLDKSVIEGVGAEIGESFKQALKKQNPKLNLYSSTGHTDDGSLRYLTEFLNNRKPVVSYGENKKKWINTATKIKKQLKGKRIRKADVSELILKYPELHGASNIRFQYFKGGSTNWLDKYQGGSETTQMFNRPIQIVPKNERDAAVNYNGTQYPTDVKLDEVTVSAKAPIWLKHQTAYEKSNPREKFIAKKKAEYFKSSPQGLDKLYGVSQSNFPKNVEQGFNAEYDYNRNNYVGDNIIKSKGADPKNRAEWVEKLNPTERAIVQNSKHGFLLEPNTYQNTLAGLAKATGLPINRTSGMTEKEYEDASILNILDPFNLPGQAIYAGLESNNWKNVPYASHDPNRALGAEEVLNPLNWTLPADLAALPSLVTSIFKGGRNLLKNGKQLITEVPKQLPGSPNANKVENKLINSNTQLSDPIHVKAVEHVNESVKKRKSIPKSELVNSQFGHTYVLPEGMTVDNLNMADLEGAQLDDVYNSIVKLNPELKNINVPKEHVLGAVSSSMAPQDIVDINKLPRLPQFIEPDPNMGFLGNFKKAYHETKWKNFTDTHKGFNFRFSPAREKEIMKNYNPKANVNELPGSPNANKVDAADYMSLEAPKGNMYGQNQVLTQQQRLLNPKIKAKFFKHQAPYIEPKIQSNIFGEKLWKAPVDYGNRITPENYERFVKNIHGSTEYGMAESTGFQPGNLGRGIYGKPGIVFSDAPLNNLGKDIINAHEKNHGMFAGTLSKEMSQDLLKPFGTKKPLSGYGNKVQADEVLARMGQFKNAVGIGDNQTFTLGHLNLIRKNYAKSFLDNGITEMLAKIKPESLGEKEFLKNMNKYAYGIGALTTLGTAGALQEKKRGGSVSELGYKNNSPYKNQPYLDINTPNGGITMKNVDKVLFAVDNTGQEKIMYPGQEYKFRGNKVREIPIAQKGNSQLTDEQIVDAFIKKEKEDAIIKKEKEDAIIKKEKEDAIIAENTNQRIKNIPTVTTYSGSTPNDLVKNVVKKTVVPSKNKTTIDTLPNIPIKNLKINRNDAESTGYKTNNYRSDPMSKEGKSLYSYTNDPEIDSGAWFDFKNKVSRAIDKYNPFYAEEADDVSELPTSVIKKISSVKNKAVGYSDFGFTKLGVKADQNKGDSLLKYRNGWDNDSGTIVKIGHDIMEAKEKVNKKSFDNVEGVAHFIRNGDILPSTNSEHNKNYHSEHGSNIKSTSTGKFLSSPKNDMDPYVMLYKSLGNDKFRIKYKKYNELTAKDKTDYPDGYDAKNKRFDLNIKSYPFSEIDWEGEGKPTGWLAQSNFVPLKKGHTSKNTQTYLPYKNKDAYTRFSGASVIFLFKDPTSGRNIGEDFSGTINEIKNRGNELVKKYGIDSSKLDVAHHDTGSYSAKPAAKNKKLHYNQWANFNTIDRGKSGAPIMIIANDKAAPTKKTGGVVRNKNVNKIPYLSHSGKLINIK